jgi:Zn-dependent M28 family amino/carboxypeptidase
MTSKTTRSLMGIAVVAVVLALPSPLLAQSNMGTWVANVAKSTYSPDPAPKSSTLTIAASGVTVDVVPASGPAQKWTYGGTYDGKPVPVTGNPNADMASRKRLSPTTTETTFTKGGKVTSVNTAVVAADGKTMTITAKGTTAEGKPLLNVQLYEKK